MRKRLRPIEVGDRPRAVAQYVVPQVVQVLAPDGVPLFLTDGYKEYMTALLTHYGPPLANSRGSYWIPGS